MTRGLEGRYGEARWVGSNVCPLVGSDPGYIVECYRTDRTVDVMKAIVSPSPCCLSRQTQSHYVDRPDGRYISQSTLAPWFRWYFHLSLLVATVGGLVGSWSSPSPAAERIYVAYQVLERSISVASLERYAHDGTIDEDLEVYAQYANANTLKELRSILRANANLGPVAISQFLYSPQGEILLERLGKVIQPEARDVSGLHAIRAALILAAQEPDGLTLLNVFRKFPTRSIRIDVERSLEIASALERLVTSTQKTTAIIQQQAALQMEQEVPFDPSQFLDLRNGGPLRWRKETRIFENSGRTTRVSPIVPTLPSATILGRRFSTDLYLPESRPDRATKPWPVVVISHGLGSDRGTFAYLAQHLASHGFAVLVPEHPGSNRKQQQALISGKANEVAEPSEFIDRPLDIQAMLDTLQRSDLAQQLNLQEVGVVGQSFGGYTALALAGATIDFGHLIKACAAVDKSLNLSLLLQCGTRKLSAEAQIPLQDRRIKAVMALNPLASAVFSQQTLKQVTLPTLILTGNADTVTPAVVEQVQPYTWLSSSEKYLAMLDRGTHFSVFASSRRPTSDEAGFILPPEVIGPNPAIARRYTSALAVAFFQTHIAQQESYRKYLSSNYAASISESPMSLTFVQSLRSDQLPQSVQVTAAEMTP